VIASSRLWFDEWTGVEASSLDDSVIEQLRPEVYRCMAHEEDDTLYIKVHDAWKLTDRGESLFPDDVTEGVVYILRNPLDIVASYAHHSGFNIEKTVECLCDPSNSLSRSRKGITDQLCQKLGTWSQHVQSWVDESGLKVLLVRYEDLRQNPIKTFGEVVRFSGHTWDPERLRRSVEFSDFSELQRQEKNNDFNEGLPNSQGQFFRRGQAGMWREEVPPYLVQRLVDVHGETMRRFGYLDENNQPV